MTYKVEADSFTARRFFQEIMGGDLRLGSKGIINRAANNEVLAAVLYDGYNGANIFPHIASRPGSRWLTRDFLRVMFHYPFVQLGCRRMTALVDMSNTRSRRFNKHLGFAPEAILKGAGSDGGDALVSVMFREDCRYVVNKGHP